MESQSQQDERMEFYRALSQFLLKQAPVIVICFMAVLAMGFFSWRLWEKQEANFSDLKDSFNSVSSELVMCREERQALSVKVAVLETRVDLIQLKTHR